MLLAGGSVVFMTLFYLWHLLQGPFFSNSERGPEYPGKRRATRVKTKEQRQHQKLTGRR
jgi:hypothetical protein